MPRGSEVSALLTRLYVPSGDFAEPAYAARTSHWAARVKREARTSGFIIRIGDCGDNFQSGDFFAAAYDRGPWRVAQTSHWGPTA
jgi:hypothetical protein